jgi:hypothetical protein
LGAPELPAELHSVTNGGVQPDASDVLTPALSKRSEDMRIEVSLIGILAAKDLHWGSI